MFFSLTEMLLYLFWYVKVFIIFFLRCLKSVKFFHSLVWFDNTERFFPLHGQIRKMAQLTGLIMVSDFHRWWWTNSHITMHQCTSSHTSKYTVQNWNFFSIDYHFTVTTIRLNVIWRNLTVSSNLMYWLSVHCQILIKR